MSEYQEIVKKCYRNFLNREPDIDGFNHYVELLKKNKIDENELVNIFKNSIEYKLSHPIEITPDISIDDRMKKEWNARTKLDPLFVIATGHSQNEDEFWKSGLTDCKQILGETQGRFLNIIKKNDPIKMKILEIGCGIGRIMIPMSKIFGEVVGVDTSSEMVQLSQKYIKKNTNCKIFENNGLDLSTFPDNHFDFCYSFIVFQHIPEKDIIENYIKEVSRVLKSECIFRFQVRGTIFSKPQEITTWDGVQFSSKEIHAIAEKYNFDIIEEGNDNEEYYWLTFKIKNHVDY